MIKINVGICYVSLLNDILLALKSNDYQLLRNYGYEKEIKNGFMKMWIDDVIENFCKPLIAYDRDSEIILEGNNMKTLDILVGKRYENLELLKNDIEIITGKNINTIIESESDRLEEMDFLIDYEFEEGDIHTLFYLKDNDGNYYITEV